MISAGSGDPRRAQVKDNVHLHDLHAMMCTCSGSITPSCPTAALAAISV
jgi:hypothetical protein